MKDQTPDLYIGRVGHDVSEGHCSCGGFHYAEDGIRAGTKTVSTLVNGEVKRIVISEDPNLAADAV